MLLIKVSMRSTVDKWVPTCVYMCHLRGCWSKQGGRFTESGFQAPLTSPSKPTVNVFLIAVAELNTGCTASAEDKSFTEQLAHLLLCSVLPMTSRHREPASHYVSVCVCVCVFKRTVCKNTKFPLDASLTSISFKKSYNFLFLSFCLINKFNIHLELHKQSRGDYSVSSWTVQIWASFLSIHPQKSLHIKAVEQPIHKLELLVILGAVYIMLRLLFH